MQGRGMDTSSKRAEDTWFIVVRPGAPSSFLFLVVMPGAPSSVLAPRSDAR